MFFLFILLFITSCQKSIPIVIDGESDYVVIIPFEAKKADSTAASYLTKYIREMTGAELPITTDQAVPEVHEFCIGNTNRNAFPYDSFAPDGFLLGTDGEKVFIAGGAHKGPVYGVIELLERWGCRMFSPTESYIPNKEELILEAFMVMDEPANNLRIINGKMTADPEFVDWLRITTIPEVAPQDIMYTLFTG